MPRSAKNCSTEFSRSAKLQILAIIENAGLYNNGPYVSPHHVQKQNHVDGGRFRSRSLAQRRTSSRNKRVHADSIRMHKKSWTMESESVTEHTTDIIRHTLWVHSLRYRRRNEAAFADAENLCLAESHYICAEEGRYGQMYKVQSLKPRYSSN